MYYKRAPFIPYERLFSLSERKVFSACRNISSTEDLIVKSELPEAEVIEIISRFVFEGLISKFDSYDAAEIYSDSREPELQVMTNF